MPKLSIITINLNNAHGLRKTIESAVSQTFIDFEYIIIDGGSTDGSLEVIKEFADKITCWVSEPDKGIYNAMNKGILKATGEYCLFLNSGDWLVDNEVIADFHNTDFNTDIVSGNMTLYWQSGKTIHRPAIHKENLQFEHFYENWMPHSASFIKRMLFIKFGLYNETLKIVSDWEFFLKCLVINHCSYSNFSRDVSYFDMTGISSLSDNRPLLEKEREHVFQTYMPLVYKSYDEKSKELFLIKSNEDEFNEYLNLKNGKFGFVIRLILFFKRKIKFIIQYLSIKPNKIRVIQRNQSVNE